MTHNIVCAKLNQPDISKKGNVLIRNLWLVCEFMDIDIMKFVPVS